MIKYRPEIDGLRAVAVVSVLLYHADYSLFAGGFVGVDVFFVISGYLITSIILAECRAGTFSLADFYERRIRRILPPLLLVMGACLPFAWLWMTPSDFKAFSEALVATTVFSSNVLFWQQQGDYFFPVFAELNPLLHTWSLAIEEQFYLLFPLLTGFARLNRLRYRKSAAVGSEPAGEHGEKGDRVGSGVIHPHAESAASGQNRLAL